MGERAAVCRRARRVAPDGSHGHSRRPLRTGNAGSNNAWDHVEVLCQALEQLSAGTDTRGLLVCCDSAGATHRLTDTIVDLGLCFSVGFDLTEPVRAAILRLPETAWQAALSVNGANPDGAEVAEVAELEDLDLSGWPSTPSGRCCDGCGEASGDGSWQSSWDAVAWAAAGVAAGASPAVLGGHRCGSSSEDAGTVAGVSPTVGTRWSREAGGMPSVSQTPLSGRYLSFVEREKITFLHVSVQAVV